MRPSPFASAVIAALFCAAGSMAAEERPMSFAPRLAESIHPGRLVARHLARDATTRLAAGDARGAVVMLERAVAADPLLAGAWTNLSAAYIDLCLADAARAAATVARTIDPLESRAATNLRLAMRLDCRPEESGHRPAMTPEEIAAVNGAPSAAAFMRAAAARRARGDLLLAIGWEERALAFGAEREATLRRIANDFLRHGLWNAAARIHDELGAEREAREIRAREDALAPAAQRLALRLGTEARFSREEEYAALFGMAEVLLARGVGESDAAERLRELLRIGRSRRHDHPWGRLAAGPRWVRVELGDGARSAPLLVLRRFPGDSQVAVYSGLDPALATGGAELSAALASRLAHRDATSLAPAVPCQDGPPALTCARVALEIVVGAEGTARIDAWVLSRPRESGRAWRIVLLALAGSAGCGEPCREAVDEEIASIVRSVEPAGRPPPAGSAAWALPVPAAWRSPSLHDEREQPWVSRKLGGIRIDFPPGFVVARQRSGFRDPKTPLSSELWFRGRFSDLQGHEVVVGDADWAGWVDVIEGGHAAFAGWRDDPARLAPPSDPGAMLSSSAPLDAVLSRARTADGGLVALFQGVAFRGRWLVYGLRVGDDAVLIALPVVRGASSPSLSWIALTVRPEQRPPLPAPFDLSDRRAVEFRRIASPSLADPRAGVLIAEHLELAVPRDFRVAISSESVEGFPVTLRRADGSTVRVERLPPAASGSIDGRKRQAAAALGVPGDAWKVHRRRRTATILVADLHTEQGGPRRVLLVVPGDAQKAPAYRVVIEPARDAEDSRFVINLVTRSLRYRR